MQGLPDDALITVATVLTFHDLTTDNQFIRSIQSALFFSQSCYYIFEILSKSYSEWPGLALLRRLRRSLLEKKRRMKLYSEWNPQKHRYTSFFQEKDLFNAACDVWLNCEYKDTRRLLYRPADCDIFATWSREMHKLHILMKLDKVVQLHATANVKDILDRIIIRIKRAYFLEKKMIMKQLKITSFFDMSL